MKNIPTSISKRVLWRYVNIKINRVIHHFHTLSVISILFEEILNDLKANKQIKIHNFGTLGLKVMPSRRYFHVKYKKIMEAKGKKILRFTLSPAIHAKIKKYIDLDKTFEGNK